MKMVKRSIALALSVVMLLSVSITAHAAEYAPQYTEEAETLYELGLFKGMGTNADGTPIFALEQKATRIQGLVMLIRLLGKEADALAYTGECPFTDVPAWAKCYAAYAYDKGITNGTSATTFSADAPLQGKAYVTFVLRALGYDDAAGDFSYNQALVLGEELGLIGADECAGEIYRDDCAQISFSALKTAMKDADTKLIDKLVADGVLTEAAVQETGILTETVQVAWDKEAYTLPFAAVYEAIPNAVYVAASGLGSNIFGSHYAAVITPETMFLSSYIVGHYCTGKTTSLPVYERNLHTSSIQRLYKGDASSIISVLDENYRLIAYGAIPPAYSEETIELTLCSYGGREMIETSKSELEAMVDNAVKVDESAVHWERIWQQIEDDVREFRDVQLVFDASFPASLREKVRYVAGGYNETLIGSVWAVSYTHLTLPTMAVV